MLTRLLWNASVGTRGYLRRYMSTNVLLDRIRQRQGLKWGIPRHADRRPLLCTDS
jgi:hypothetical protein